MLACRAEENGVVLEVYYEECPENPRKRDNLGTMVCWHRRYRLGDRHNFATPGDFTNYVTTELKGQVLMQPLYLLDHSGLVMSTAPFNDPWDSGQVGWIYVTKDRVRNGLGVKRITAPVRAWAMSILEAEVELYNHYLSGEVFWYMLRAGNEVIDSCGGFYGSDFRQNGMAEYLPPEYQHLVDMLE
mgnify:CR=1 FL=1